MGNKKQIGIHFQKKENIEKFQAEIIGILYINLRKSEICDKKDQNIRALRRVI